MSNDLMETILSAIVAIFIGYLIGEQYDSHIRIFLCIIFGSIVWLITWIDKDERRKHE